MSRQTATLKSQGNVAKGALLVVLSAAAFALGGTAAKFLTPELNATALLFWRNLLAAIFLVGWFGIRGLPQLNVGKIPLHALRAGLTYGGLLAYFVAIAAIPLADAVLLRASSPIFVPILAFIAYRRLSDRNVWAGVMVGFVGIACILKPALLGVSSGELIGVISGLLGGAAAICIWALSDSEPADAQMFYFTIFSLVYSCLPLPWLWQAPALAAVPGLLCVAVFTTLAQTFLAMGCVAAPADKILAWGYTSVAFGALAGYLGWDETIGLVSGLGIGMVVIGSHWASRRQQPTG